MTGIPLAEIWPRTLSPFTLSRTLFATSKHHQVVVPGGGLPSKTVLNE